MLLKSGGPLRCHTARFVLLSASFTCEFGLWTIDHCLLLELSIFTSLVFRSRSRWRSWFGSAFRFQFKSEIGVKVKLKLEHPLCWTLELQRQNQFKSGIVRTLCTTMVQFLHTSISTMKLFAELPTRMYLSAKMSLLAISSSQAPKMIWTLAALPCWWTCKLYLVSTVLRILEMDTMV